MAISWTLNPSINIYMHVQTLVNTLYNEGKHEFCPEIILLYLCDLLYT